MRSIWGKDGSMKAKVFWLSYRFKSELLQLLMFAFLESFIIARLRISSQFYQLEYLLKVFQF